MATYIGVDSLVTARASAALPAAGAWDASPTEFFVSGVDDMGVHLTYTQGAAGGAADIQLQLSPYSITALVPAGAQEWVNQTLYGAGTVAAGADSQSRMQAEYVTFDPVTANAEAVTFAVINLGGVFERARVRARESGQEQSPGTAQITVTLNGYQPAGML